MGLEPNGTTGYRLVDTFVSGGDKMKKFKDFPLLSKISLIVSFTSLVISTSALILKLLQ